MLSKNKKSELEAFKKKVGEEKVKELWDIAAIPERNRIKCINAVKRGDNLPAQLGHCFSYTDSNKKKRDCRYIGFYLYGEIVKDSERVILVDGESAPKVVTTSSLKPYSHNNQKPFQEGELESLVKLLSEPQAEPTPV